MIRTFSESELILYADGELDREDVPAIEAFIAKNPEAEEFVRKVRKANELVIQSHYPDMRIFDEGEKEEFFLKFLTKHHILIQNQEFHLFPLHGTR